MISVKITTKIIHRSVKACKYFLAYLWTEPIRSANHTNVYVYNPLSEFFFHLFSFFFSNEETFFVILWSTIMELKGLSLYRRCTLRTKEIAFRKFYTYIFFNLFLLLFSLQRVSKCFKGNQQNLPSTHAIVAETFSERVMINFQLCYLEKETNNTLNIKQTWNTMTIKIPNMNRVRIIIIFFALIHICFRVVAFKSISLCKYIPVHSGRPWLQ